MNFELIDKIQDVITIVAIPVFTFVVIYILVLVRQIKKDLKNKGDLNGGL